MNDSDYNQRFSGLMRLYGAETYAHLKGLHIAIVGIGGVGSWAVESLARSGVGKITLIDFDEVSITNVNRQVPALTSTVGKKKTQVMKERVLQINPDCECHIIDDFLTLDNMSEYIRADYDGVIDAIDSITFKAALIYFCRRNKIMIITTGGAGGCTDPTAVQIADLSNTYNDALASKVRKRLREDFHFPSKPKRRFNVPCVFSKQQPVYPKEDGSVSHAKPGIHGVHLDCSMGYGASSFVTATFGLMAAARCLEKALKAKQG